MSPRCEPLVDKAEFRVGGDFLLTGPRAVFGMRLDAVARGKAWAKGGQGDCVSVSFCRFVVGGVD